MARRITRFEDYGRERVFYSLRHTSQAREDIHNAALDLSERELDPKHRGGYGIRPLKDFQGLPLVDGREWCPTFGEILEELHELNGSEDLPRVQEAVMLLSQTCVVYEREKAEAARAVNKDATAAKFEMIAESLTPFCTREEIIISPKDKKPVVWDYRYPFCTLSKPKQGKKTEQKKRSAWYDILLEIVTADEEATAELNGEATEKEPGRKKPRRRYPQDKEAVAVLAEGARRKKTEAYHGDSNEDIIKRMIEEPQSRWKNRILYGKLTGKAKGQVRERTQPLDIDGAASNWGKYLSAYMKEHPNTKE